MARAASTARASTGMLGWCGPAVAWGGHFGGDLLAWVVLVDHWPIHSIFKLVAPPPGLATTSLSGMLYGMAGIRIEPGSFPLHMYTWHISEKKT